MIMPIVWVDMSREEISLIRLEGIKANGFRFMDMDVMFAIPEGDKVCMVTKQFVEGFKSVPQFGEITIKNGRMYRKGDKIFAIYDANNEEYFVPVSYLEELAKYNERQKTANFQRV